MKQALGRGLDAFFGDTPEEVEEITTPNKAKREKKNNIVGEVLELNIVDIEPMLNQPRKVFDKEKLQELAESIKQHGVLQPLLVVKIDDRYTIIAGERRWRAAKLAELKTIPVIVKDYDDGQKKQIALIENIQREDLNPIEVAKAIKELMDVDGYTMQDVAKITVKSLPTVSNLLRLLKLPEEVIEYVIQGKLVEGQARALLALDDPNIQISLANKIIEEKMTVKEVEQLIYGKKKAGVKNKETKKNITMQKIEQELKDYFSTKVKLDARRDKGRIIIQYFNNEELDRILEKLNIRL